MDYNSLIEIGSKANVILRFKAPININGQSYVADEPYLFLKDVNVVVNYSNQDKTGDTNKTVIANSDIKPRSVSIGGLSFTRKVAALLANYKSGNIEYNPTLFKTLAAEDDTIQVEDDGELVDIYRGIIFLTEELKNNNFLFVFDDKFDKIDKTKILYDGDMNALISEDFEDGKEYLISFSTVKSGSRFDLCKPHTPYMSLEIQGVGNIDKTTKNVLMYFDKVSLNSLLYFTFIQGDMINVPLEFHIIDDKNNYVVFED